ncbi:Vegetative incompatibility protein HET-E-1 like [Verticillium longisporum]|nr:Vegetative incompatibility protein HET-E-1 like [Verticillium longisporum]
MSSITVAIAGGTGNLGYKIVQALLSDQLRPRFRELVVLARNDSEKTASLESKGAAIRLYSEGNLKSALEGVNVLINTVGATGHHFKEQLLRALPQSSVKLYFPSEFGVDHYVHDFAHDEWDAKKNHIRLAEELIPEIRVCRLFPGLFLEDSIGPWFGFHTKLNRYEAVGSPDEPTSYTSMHDVGRALAALAVLPPAEVPEKVHLAGDTKSVAEIARIMEQASEDQKPIEVTTLDLHPYKANLLANPEPMPEKYLRFLMGEGLINHTAGGLGNDNSIIEGDGGFERWKSIKEMALETKGKPWADYQENPALEEDHENIDPSALPTDLSTQNGPDTPHDSRPLWKQAYDKLREEERDLVLNFQTLVAQEAQRQDQSQKLPGDLVQDQDPTYHNVHKLCQDGKQRMEDAEIRFKLRNKDHKVGEMLDKGIRMIAWGKDLVSTALGKTASFEVSIVWAATILVLPLLGNVQKAKDMNDSVFIYVTGTLKYYLALEPELQKSHGSCSQELVEAAEESIIALYKAILSFQLRDAVDYDGWETMLQSVKDAEKLFAERWRPLQRTASEDCLRQLKEETVANLERLESRALSLEEQEHLQVLRPQNASQDLSYESAKERTEDRVPGTCKWLLEEKKYQDWLRKAHGLLMVSADPGCGKSVLAKHLIDERLLEDANDATICYFFFKEDDQDRLCLALCALLHQLLIRKPSLIKRHLVHEHAKNGNSLQNNTTILWRILEASLRDSDTGPVIIVLDGLDECRQADFQVLARSANHLLAVEKQSHATTRWLFTTRPYQSITNMIVASCIRVYGEEKSATIRQEVKIVIQHRVRDPKLQKIIPQRLLSRLEERLLSVENPTYLWAALTFRFVETSHFKKTIKGLEDAIENLPRSINDAYSKILSRTDESLQPIIRKAFTIVLGAAAPLTIAEMNVAMNLDEGVNDFESLDMEDEQTFKRSLREITGLFIITHNDRVYFLHQTVREFFQSLDPEMPMADLPTQWQHSFSPKLSNSFMARICLRYNWLYNNDPQLPSFEINGYHVSKDLVYQTVHKMTGYRVGDKIQEVDDWIERHPHMAFHCYAITNTTQHLEGNFGEDDLDLILVGVVRLLITQPQVNIECCNGHGRTALCLAGTARMRRLLLKSGANPHPPTGSVLALPIWYAIQRGKFGYLDYLLSKAKSPAAKHDMLKIVLETALLDYPRRRGMALGSIHWGADINALNNQGSTLLHHHATRGYVECVKFLLDLGADVTVSNRNGQTPLKSVVHRLEEETDCFIEDELVEIKTLLESSKVAKMSDEYLQLLQGEMIYMDDSDFEQIDGPDSDEDDLFK